MKKSLVALLILLTLQAFPAQAKNTETPPLSFVQLYIEQLGTTQAIADKAEEGLKAGGKSQALDNCIQTMAKYQSELGSQVAAMQQVHLSKAYAFLPKTIAGYDQEKISLYQQYGEDCTTIEEGPKPGVDYKAVAAELTKIEQQLQLVDQDIFKTAPAVFATLIQTKENSRGGADHLSITKAEKAALTHRLKELFGPRLGVQSGNYIINAASVIDFYLEKKGFKCADEPWD